MIRRRILFVDDETKILEGLRRSLRPMREEWEAVFADGGEQALRVLQDQAVDVVVTDMRMPVMDGAAFLAEVARRHPGLGRIILSGQSDREASRRAEGVAHLFLSKPCDLPRLREAVARVCRLRDGLASAALTTLVGRWGDLPRLPDLLRDRADAGVGTDPGAERVLAVIAGDPELAAEVRNLAGDPALRLDAEATVPSELVRRIGIGGLWALVLGIRMVQVLGGIPPSAYAMASWRRACVVAGLARDIATRLDLAAATVEAAFASALLHDAGTLLFARYEPGRYAEVLERAAEVDLISAEREAFAVDHGLLGGHLLRTWGLPDPVIEAVAFQAQPSAGPGTGWTPGAAVHLAMILADGQDGHPSGWRAALDQELVGAHGVGRLMEEMRSLLVDPA